MMDLTKARDDERGIAMVVVMLVSMVILSLSVTIVQLADNESVDASSDRKAVEAVQTVDTAFAEYMAVLPTTSDQEGLCSAWDSVARAAAAQVPEIEVASDSYPINYELEITFVDEDGNDLDCTTFDGTQTLDTATVIATANVGRGCEDLVEETTCSSIQAHRRFQVGIDLDPIPGAGVTTAIYGACDVHLEGNKTIYENVVGTHDADVYAGCNLYADANLGNSSEFYGSFVARGNITAGGMYMGGNFWAKGNISTSGGPCVGVKTPLSCGYGDDPADYIGNTLEETGYIVSTQGDLVLSGYILNRCVAPNGTITGAAGPSAACKLRDWVSGPDIYKLSGGAVPPGFYPTGQSCAASGAAGVTLMGRTLCEDPPKITFPAWSYSAADWAGYADYNETTCAQAQADIVAGFVGDTLVDLRTMSPDCDLTFNGGGNTNINGNLGILTDGAVHFQSMSWTGVGGTRKVMIIHPTTETAGALNSCPYKYTDAGVATAYGADAQDDITFANNTSFTNIEAMFYSPCSITLDNLSSFDGQVIAGSATTSNNGTLQFRQVDVPGLGSPVGYTPTVLYVQELPHTGV